MRRKRYQKDKKFWRTNYISCWLIIKYIYIYTITIAITLSIFHNYQMIDIMIAMIIPKQLELNWIQMDLSSTHLNIQDDSLLTTGSSSWTYPDLLPNPSTNKSVHRNIGLYYSLVISSTISLIDSIFSHRYFPTW